jgi:hypothetical protein
MAREQHAFCTAVEVATTDTLIITEAGTGNTQTINPSQTLFPNVFALFSDLCNQITLVSTTGAFNTGSLSASYELDKFAFSSSAADLVTITGTLAAHFGFTCGESVTPIGGDTAIIATYKPKYIWFPTYAPSDTEWFSANPADTFSGNIGMDGNLSGYGFTAKKKRVMQFPCESATNAIEYADSATAVQVLRCFQYVINYARAMTLAESGSSNLYCKGVYYIPNVDTMTTAHIADTAGLPTTWGTGSITGEYLFASPGAPVIRGASNDRSRKYYDVELELTVATAPSWGWDITPA